jgi:hypothetical protein
MSRHQSQLGVDGLDVAHARTFRPAHGLTSWLLYHLVAERPFHVGALVAANWIAITELQIGHLITLSDLGLRFLQRERSDVIYVQALRHGDFVVTHLGLIGHAAYPARDVLNDGAKRADETLPAVTGGRDDAQTEQSMFGG